MSTSAREGGLFAEPGRGGRRPILTVAGLSAWYGELRALHDVSFDVAPGEVLAVIGANGAGKSTLLKSITGMMNRGRAAHIEGTIDMTFLEDGTWTVVDFKTDADLDAEIEKYSRQVGWYVYAMRAMTGDEARGVLLGV